MSPLYDDLEEGVTILYDGKQGLFGSFWMMIHSKTELVS